MSSAAKRKPVTTSSTTTTRTVSRPDADAIRRRAYELYVQRKGGPGDPVSDWIRAERELSARSRA